MAIKQLRKGILSTFLSHDSFRFIALYYASIFKSCSIENMRNKKMLPQYFFFIKMRNTIVYVLSKSVRDYCKMLLSVVFGLFISGCGQSGPLYLPPHIISPITPASHATSHATTASSTSTTT